MYFGSCSREAGGEYCLALLMQSRLCCLSLVDKADLKGVRHGGDAEAGATRCGHWRQVQASLG